MSLAALRGARSFGAVAMVLVACGGAPRPRDATPATAPTPTAATAALLGAWRGTSIEADGTSASAEDAHRMRFTFHPDVLLIAGNQSSDLEQVADYAVDPSSHPARITIRPRDTEDSVLGIYELAGQELRLCVRHGSASGMGFPTELRTTPGSHLILMTFVRERSP